MDGDGLLSRSCVERGWRYSRLDESTFFFDERSEYLARVDDSVARLVHLSSSMGSLRDTLGRLSRTTRPESEPVVQPRHVVSLRLLGVRVDVWCVHEKCANVIQRFYSASVVPPGHSSPEVLVSCDWEDAGRYLFRSRPDDAEGVPLAGVSVQTLRSEKHEWTSVLPPIPALASWPFKDRFVALHAAAVRTASGEAVLIAGGRGAGKSTTALALSDRIGVDVLCDETAFVHCRTIMVEPFPHAVGVWQGGRKLQVPITDVCRRICYDTVPVGRIVFLNQSAGGSGKAYQVPRSDALRELLLHHRDAGASMGDSMQTLLGLLARSDAWSVSYSDPKEITDLVCGLIGS